VCLETIIEIARMLMANLESGFSGSGFLFHPESQGFSHCWLKLFDTQFMTKMAKKPSPLRPHIPI